MNGAIKGPVNTELGLARFSREIIGQTCHREDCDGHSAGAIVKHIREDSSHTSERASSEESTEESTDKERLQVLRHCN